ncbi:helix-turn-helix domain-containing protein [Cohnella sp. CFH 77786]|nr:helix-turn-helix domain-containing protein [Cohnella sp. CFH 77786]
MTCYSFRVDSPVSLVMTGKFVAPSSEWKHMYRVLLEFELFIQTRGTLYIAMDKERHVLNEGDFLLMPPQAVQYGYRESDCSFYWLHFTVQGGYETLESGAAGYQPGVITIPAQGTLRSPDKLIVMMKQLQDSVRSYREQTLNNYLTTSILCELYNQLSIVQNQSRKNRKQQLYNDIVDYIKWNRMENMKVNQLAEHFGYNAKYLSFLFSEIAGISLKQFMLQEKTDAAKSLLTDTNQSIKEISQQLGYSESHQFTHSFKKMTGLAPTDYRNAYSSRLLFYK